MKTSQLYIEQVLIGALIILIVSLPWLPEFLKIDLKDVSTVAGLAGGSLVLGAAFWLGIPFDRFSDTLLDRLNRHNRLRFTLRHARGTAVPENAKTWMIARHLPFAHLGITGGSYPHEMGLTFS